MKSLPFLLSLAGLVAGGAQGGDNPLLRRTLPGSKPEVYKVNVHEYRAMSSEYFDKMEFDTTRKCTVVIDATKSPAATDKVNVDLTYRIDDEFVDGPSDGQVPEQKPVLFKGTLDDHGTLAFENEKASIEELSTRLTLSAAEASVVVPLPEKTVKVGDTWEIPIPGLNGKGQEPQKLTAKFAGEKKVGDQTAWVISTTGTVTTMSEQSMSFQVQGRELKQTFVTKTVSDVQGDSLLDQKTGRTIRSTTKLKKRMTMTIQSEKSESKINGDYTTTITTLAE